MKVLVACEESQAVCKAFREKGHEAYSCDVQPCSGGHPEWHIQGDALETMRGGQWDMVIAFPPCTYMTNAGAVRMRVNGEIQPERYSKAMDAKRFFLEFWNAEIPKIAIENPTPMKIVGLPPCSQVIQPFWFGHPYSKRTCLWLKGLPPLMPTEVLSYHKPYVSCGTSRNKGNKEKSGVSRAGGAQKVRSKTFPGIAKAMADQWG